MWGATLKGALVLTRSLEWFAFHYNKLREKNESTGERNICTIYLGSFKKDPELSRREKYKRSALKFVNQDLFNSSH